MLKEIVLKGQSFHHIQAKVRCSKPERLYSNLPIMSFEQASNDEFSVEFVMFVLTFFQPTLKSDLKEV